MLKFIGNGSAFSKTGNTSAYYKTEDGTMLLIDCGETVFQDLLKKNTLDGVKNLVVLITHSHSDHCGSLSGLIWYSKYILKTKIAIVAPHAVFHILDEMGNPRDSYYREYSRDHVFHSFGPFRFISVETIHQEAMECFGYSISIDIGMEVYNCYYSGDTQTFNPNLITSLQENKINDIYCDITEYNGDDNVHMNLDKLLDLVPKNLRSSVHLMHFSDTFNKQQALDLGFKLTEVS